MKIAISKGYKSINNELDTYFSKGDVILSGDNNIKSIKLSNGGQLFAIGNIIGIRDSNNGMQKVNENDISRFVKSNFSIDNIRDLEGRFLIIYCDPDGKIKLATDRYGQFDVYYCSNGDKFTFASDLSLLPDSPSNDGYDQVGLAHALAVYGYRPAKKHTLYKNVKRLGVGETVTVDEGKLKFNQFPFEPRKIRDYGDEDHQLYSDLFLDSLKVRGSENGNVVYLSSGWDSTSILGGLVHIFGSDKVKAVIGRMRYSERAGTINPFEIERAQKVADYYNVDLNIVDFDYTKDIPNIFSHMKSGVKNHFIASPNIFTHGILADYIAKNFSNNESVFCGEISDGVHNFGFSQYATIFHPVLDFREYSDKMASYLYGPTFLSSFEKNTFEEDVIYNLLKSRTGETIFDDLKVGENVKIRKQILASFFLRNQRLPLVSMDNVKMLTSKGRNDYSKEMESTYLEDAAKALKPETCYSWYLHLYNSFHWQGATVATLPLTAQEYGFNIHMPFYDSRLQEFLACMPEDWGRGLDFNPTKYPLKWMLKNQIDYPMHLQVGPHSYLYDVDHSFSHAVEFANHSAFTPVFRDLLATKSYHDILSNEIFNLDYIDSIVDRYISGEEISGPDLNVLFPICFSTLFGWY